MHELRSAWMKRDGDKDRTQKSLWIAFRRGAASINLHTVDKFAIGAVNDKPRTRARPHDRNSTFHFIAQMNYFMGMLSLNSFIIIIIMCCYCHSDITFTRKTVQRARTKQHPKKKTPPKIPNTQFEYTFRHCAVAPSENSLSSAGPDQISHGVNSATTTKTTNSKIEKPIHFEIGAHFTRKINTLMFFFHFHLAVLWKSNFNPTGDSR